MTIYAIGDIHGHLDKLLRAHARIEADRAREGTADAPVIHVGDLVDRGPDSAGVVGHLAEMVARDARVFVLLGNHDAMFLEFLTNRPPRWSDSPYLSAGIGGRETLASYGLDVALPARSLHDAAQEVVPVAHCHFLAERPRLHEAGDCVFVHAGIQPGVPLPEQNPADLIWIRDAFLFDTRDHGRLVVHGHTPVIRVEHHGNRLAIDTGAAWDGDLSAVAIEGREAWLLTETGRLPVPRLA
ncbi:MAG: metallophosphoesterase [Roseicyclus sp.]